MEILKPIIAVFFCIILSASLTMAGGKDRLELVKDDNGKEVTVQKGGIIEIRLEEPGATGYSWEVMDLDQSRLELLDSESTPKNQSGNLVGGPVLKKWRFKAVNAGTTNLKLVLYRVWEGPDKAADRFQVRISVL